MIVERVNYASTSENRPTRERRDAAGRNRGKKTEKSTTTGLAIGSLVIKSHRAQMYLAKTDNSNIAKENYRR